MATHSSILAWKIPWTEETGKLQSIVSQRIGHDWVTNIYSHGHTHTHTHIWSKPLLQVYHRSFLSASLLNQLCHNFNMLVIAELGTTTLIQHMLNKYYQINVLSRWLIMWRFKKWFYLSSIPCLIRPDLYLVAKITGFYMEPEAVILTVHPPKLLPKALFQH